MNSRKIESRMKIEDIGCLKDKKNFQENMKHSMTKGDFFDRIDRITMILVCIFWGIFCMTLSGCQRIDDNKTHGSKTIDSKSRELKQNEVRIDETKPYEYLVEEYFRRQSTGDVEEYLKLFCKGFVLLERRHGLEAGYTEEEYDSNIEELKKDGLKSETTYEIIEYHDIHKLTEDELIFINDRMEKEAKERGMSPVVIIKAYQVIVKFLSKNQGSEIEHDIKYGAYKIGKTWFLEPGGLNVLDVDVIKHTLERKVNTYYQALQNKNYKLWKSVFCEDRSDVLMNRKTFRKELNDNRIKYGKNIKYEVLNIYGYDEMDKDDVHEMNIGEETKIKQGYYINVKVKISSGQSNEQDIKAFDFGKVHGKWYVLDIYEWGL